MKALDDTLAILEDVVLAVTYAVGRQAPFAFAQAHTAPGGMEANPHLLGSANLVVQGSSVGKEIQVVGHGGCATQHHFAQPDLGADVHGLAVHLGPDRVQGFEPVEENHPPARAHRASESLIEMMVAVDQARHNDRPTGVDGAMGW